MDSQQTIPRSMFVSVIAWIFIAISGFIMVSSLVQFVLFTYVPQAEHMQQTVQAMMHAHALMPPLTRFMTNHLRVFNLIFLCESIILFVVSIALLKRKSWGRVAFIVVLVIGVIWELTKLVTKVSFLAHMPQLSNTVPAQFRSIQEAALVFSSIFAAVLSIFFVWIIIRMLSTKIKTEFTR